MAEIEGVDPGLRMEKPWSWEKDDKDSPFVFLDEIQWGEADYSFDLTRLWVYQPTGELFVADDSGCSCPSPFEDTTVADLTPITRLQDFYDYISDKPDYWKHYPSSVDDQARLVRKIGDRLSGKV